MLKISRGFVSHKLNESDMIFNECIFFQLSFWCNYTCIPSHHIIVQTGTTFPADLCLTSPSWADACCPRWHAWSVWWRCWGKGHWVWRGPYSPSSPGSAADTSSSREKAGSGPSWKPRKCGLLICRWTKIHIQEKKALTNCLPVAFDLCYSFIYFELLRKV